MAADFSFVAHAAQRKADKVAPGGTGHGLGQRGFAHAGRAHKAEDGAAQPVGELLHGQVFQNAFFGFFQPVVVAVQNGASFFDIYINIFKFVPGQVQNPVHIVAHHRVFRGGGRHGAQFFGFGQGFLAGLFRHAAGFELLLNFVHFGLGVVLAAHLLVDGLDLLVEIVFALVALHLDLDAVFDALFHGGQSHLALQQGVGAFQAQGHIVQFQGFLFFAVVHLEVGQDGVGQGAGFVQGHDGEHGLLRNFFVGLAVFFQGFVGSPHQGLGLFWATLDFGPAAHHYGGAGLGFGKAGPLGAEKTFKQHLDGAVGQAQHLQHLADHAHGGQVFGGGFFQVGFALGHQKNLFVVVGLGGLNSLDGCLAPHKEGHDGAREHDHLTQRHEGQLGAGRSVTLSIGHTVLQKMRLSPWLWRTGEGAESPRPVRMPCPRRPGRERKRLRLRRRTGAQVPCPCR